MIMHGLGRSGRQRVATKTMMMHGRAVRCVAQRREGHRVQLWMDTQHGAMPHVGSSIDLFHFNWVFSISGFFFPRPVC
jgi:hypothetical protein